MDSVGVNDPMELITVMCASIKDAYIVYTFIPHILNCANGC